MSGRFYIYEFNVGDVHNFESKANKERFRGRIECEPDSNGYAKVCDLGTGKHRIVNLDNVRVSRKLNN